MKYIATAAAAHALALLLTGCSDGMMLPAEPAAASSAPVIQGTPVDRTVFPAAGALVIRGVFFCSGTLVTPTAVLTASHCLEPRYIGPGVPGFTFAADARSVEPADVHAGREAFQHPDFDLDWLGLQHDVGILLLEEPVLDVEPVPLARPADVAGLAVGATLDLVGYGLTTPDGVEAGVKHHGRAELTSIDTFLYGIGVPGEVQNCSGDSGGPAFLEIAPGEHRVIGVVTAGPDGCTRGGFDVRVDAHIDWLLAASRGELPACDPPLVLCDRACVDLASDRGSCGACGRVCLADERCESGRCRVEEPDAGPPDAGPPDAGPPELPDAGLGPDAGLPAPGAGCSCRASGPGRAAPAALCLLAAFGALARRRRR